MPSLLRIDASSRTHGSFSRSLAETFETEWKAKHPGGAVVRRDLVDKPIGHIEQNTITGFYTPADALDVKLKKALALSDELIDELNRADTVLIATPIYNFTIPSALKAWVDQIVRINKTFSYDGSNFTGLVKAKHVVVVAAFGAGGYGEAMAAADFVTPYLKFLFGFLGVADVKVIATEATTADEKTAAGNAERAKGAVRELLRAA